MDVQTHESVLDELVHQGRYLYPPDIVKVIECHHPHTEPGIPRVTISTYVDRALNRLGKRAPYTLQRFESLVQGRLTDANVWLPDAVYEVAPGRLSVYPPSWHDRLAGSRDPVEYVAVIRADLAAMRGMDGDSARTPVPKQLLLDAMTVLGRMNRRSAGGLIRDARLAGRIRVDPDQNPDADVFIVPTPASPQPAGGQTTQVSGSDFGPVTPPPTRGQ